MELPFHSHKWMSILKKKNNTKNNLFFRFGNDYPIHLNPKINFHILIFYNRLKNKPLHQIKMILNLLTVLQFEWKKHLNLDVFPWWKIEIKTN